MEIYTHKNDNKIRLGIQKLSKAYPSVAICYVLDQGCNFVRLINYPKGLFPETRICKLKNLIKLS